MSARLLFALFILASNYSLAIDPIYSGKKNKLAIDGYDPVAYFISETPVKGLPLYTSQYKGATWSFSSQDNKKLFLKNPDKYMPQFGGYCAYAISKDRVAKVDPKLFVMHDNKLYLSFNKKVQKRFTKDIDGYIKKAHKNWPALLNKD